MKQNLTTILRVGITLSAIAAIILLGYSAEHTLSCLLFSFVLAYLLDPFVVLLERRRVSRLQGILILYALLAVFSYFCVTILIPLVTTGWNSLVLDLPDYYNKASQLALELKGRFGLARSVQEWNWLVDSIQNGADKILAKIGAGAYAAASSLVLNLFNLLLAPILVYFMLFYKTDTLEGIKRWLPASHRGFILAVGRDINDSIGGYIRGQVIVSIIVAVISSVAMMILNINHPIFCGIFAGIASIIPFIGVLLATLPPLFFAYAEYQSGMLLLQVMTAFAVIYFVEGYVIKPLVFKKSMDLNPLVTILMVMLMGELMGFWGILLGIPCAGAIKIFFAHLRRESDLADEEIGMNNNS
ncbi:MAG: AI-2E family transporter [Geobacteraceae bacterium]|nr:AI-2E family transporter [Geobacteraceae bacterium]